VRFIFAVGFFLVSLILLVSGLLIRHAFSAPDSFTQTVYVDGDAPVTLIDADELARVSGAESITVSGATQTDPQIPAPITLAWGRKSDVVAWVGNAPYQALTVNPETREIVSRTVPGIESEIPNPAGSDLWFEEWTGEGEVSANFALSDKDTVLIAGSGVVPAPRDITIVWTIDVDRTIPTTLLYLGAFFAIGGVIAFAIGMWRERVQRRIRRQGRMPKAPRGPRWKPPRRSLGAGGGRRPRRRRLAEFAAILVAVPLALAGCAPAEVAQPTPLPTEVTDAPPVAISPMQFERVVAAITATLAEADSSSSDTIAETRLTGAALRFREANYRVSRVDASLVTLFTIPDASVSLLLPQQTDDWPRSVFAIIEDTANEESPSIALVLTQESPRENYRVSYTFALEPGVVIPEVPSAEFGAAVLAADTDLLAATAEQIAEQYGDVLLLGEESAFSSVFEPDTLQEQIGVEAKAARAEVLAGQAAFSWVETMAEDTPIVFASSDAGGIVALTITESETVKPAASGAAITTEGSIKILSGRPSSLRGITANYDYQLLFYVPSIGSAEKIRLLGYSYSLVSASEAR
jgi:hypothetical protein